MNSIVKPIDHVGSRFLAWLDYIKSIWLMAYLSIRSSFVHQSQGYRTIFGVISAQIYFTGWQAIPLMSMLALSSGTIVILQSSTNLSILGRTEMIGNLMVVIIVRELGPLLTALVVIARSGTAVASELGNMRVNREIEALETMGIDPYSFIIFPRLLGGLISVICLGFYFNLVALMGGFFISRLIHAMPLNFYLDSIASAFSSEDLWLYFIKSSFSGIMIFVIACYHGLQVKQSPHEVPQVTTKAVVNSIIAVVLFNLTVTTIFYLNRLIELGII